MTNIPTDLLRTLIAVVDLRSFTKAALQLGVTQPAVSAQIKRLQFLLGGELFDRGVQGISLTAHGETVVNYARRMLSINDQIMQLRDDRGWPELVIRIGTPSDYIASILPGILAQFRRRRPDVRFNVRAGRYEPLARDLRNGDLDIFIGLSVNPRQDARHTWAQEVIWVRGKDTVLDPGRPVPLVSHGEASTYHDIAVTALKLAGLEWESVFTGPSLISLDGAVTAGLGVMAITRRRADALGMLVWEDPPLPKLPDLQSGIFVRETGDRAAYEQLADEIADVIRSPSAITPRLSTVFDTVRKANSSAA